MNDALDLELAADQRIDLAVARELVQVLRELVERRTLAVALFLLGLGAVRFVGLRRLRRVGFLDAVGNEVHHVEPRHALLVQVVHRVRILLAEDRDQHVGSGHFFLTAAGGLHMHDRALDHALETKSGLRVDLVRAADGGRVLLDELRQALAQIVDVGRASAQHFSRRGVVEQCHQQMLNGDEFMSLLARLDERHVQADF